MSSASLLPLLWTLVSGTTPPTAAVPSAPTTARPPPQAVAPVERVQYALIVAYNGSNDPALAPLRYADDDGARYHALLAPQSKETILLSVLDAETQRKHPELAAKTLPPTRRELMRALARLDRAMEADRAAGREPVLYLVYSGHGRRGPAGEGTVTLLDHDLTRTALYEQILAPSRARYVHLIVDACDSYYLVNARGLPAPGASLAGAVTQHLDARSLERLPHVGVVLSTASQRESHEWEGFEGGVFSHQVRSALAGAADVNADGRIEYSELRAFVAAASARVEDPRGRPEVFARAPAQDGAAALMDLTRSSGLAYLSVPAERAGHHWIEDHRGVRLADFHKEAGQPLVLAIPAGRPLFLREGEREAELPAGVPGGVTDAGSLRWRRATVLARGALGESFRQDLFSVPFGPRFYLGFVSSTGETPVSPAQSAELTP